MKIAILGDLHLGGRGASEVLMYHQDRFFKFLFEYLEQYGIDTVFQLGDCFDQRRQTNMMVLSFAQGNLFNILRDKKIHFHTLIGNHDIYYRENLDVHSTGLLLNPYENVSVYDTPTTIELGGKTFDFIPWMAKSNEAECMEFIRHSKSDYVLGHFRINGFEVLSNVECKNGLERSEFSNYRYCFSGHFHKRSVDLENRIIYVGTPYALTWNDASDVKGFYVLDTETGGCDFVCNPQKYYYNLYYDDVRRNTTDISELSLSKGYVRIHVVNKTEPFQYERFLNAVYACKPADVKILEKEISLNQDENDTVVFKDHAEIIDDYLNSRPVSVDKQAVREFVLKLYDEAMKTDKMGG